MKKNRTSAKLGFLKIYYSILIFSALLSFLGLILNFSKSFVLWWSISFIFYVGVFVLSIIAIVRFKQDKYPSIVFVLPIFELCTYAIDFIIGIVGATLAFRKTYLNASLLEAYGWWGTLIVSLIEFCLSVYVLKKLSK